MFLDIFAKYPIDISASIISFYGSFLCSCFLGFKYRKRKYALIFFILFLVFGFFVGYLLGWLKGVINNINFNVVISFFMGALNLGMLFVLFKEHFIEIILCEATTLISTSISGNLYSLLLNACGVDTTSSISFFPGTSIYLDYFILGLFHVICYLVIAIFYQKRKKIQFTTKNILFLTLFIILTALINNVLNNYSYNLSRNLKEFYILFKVYFLISSSLMLVIIFSIIQNNQLSYEMQVTNELLKKEKKEYLDAKKNIESINMMVHDLKHHISDISSKLTDEELTDFKKAIQIYDSNVKTGNEILDAIFYEKHIICNQKNIRFSCLAEGKILEFISSNHLYSFFSNALDNAIESEENLTDSEKKVISVTIHRENNLAHIEISNYCLLNQKQFVSLKSDQNQHGYGLKSMQFVTEYYHGNMDFQIADDIVTLVADFPLSEEKTQKS
ncbi:MAG: ATP-binding protein [Bacilli bacterium]